MRAMSFKAVTPLYAVTRLDQHVERINTRAWRG
jgi:hypothetical protein